MVELKYYLVSANGTRIDLQGQTYRLMTGFTGVGMLPVQVNTTTSALDGSKFRSLRKEARVLDLPITIMGDDRAAINTALRTLQKAVSGRQAVTLRGEYSDGTAYTLATYYQSGAEVQYGATGTGRHVTLVLTLLAPDPYWVSVTPVNFSFGGSATTGRGLLPNLAQLKLSGSQAIGDIELTNSGDVPAYLNWTITGQVDSVEISLDGVGFTYEDSIASGSSIYVNGKEATVVNGSGTNLYAGLAAAPKFFTLPTGTNTITVTATNTDTSTKISGYFLTRREVLY